MAEATAITTGNAPFKLEVYNLELIKSELVKRVETEGTPLQGFFTDLVQELFGSSTDCETRSNTLTHICASGLTAKEVINRVADIEDKELRKKLGASIRSFIVSNSSAELQKAFDINFNFDDLDDTKGDINVQEHTTKNTSSKRRLNVYYAKCLIRRQDNKYDLNVAFYDFVSTFPAYSVLVYPRSKQNTRNELEIAKATAFNSLHRRLKAAWPDKIVLEEQNTLPSETC